MRLKILSARSACVTNYLAYTQCKLNFFSVFSAFVSVSFIILFVYAGVDLHRTYLWIIAGTPTTVWRLGAVQAFIFPFVDSPTPRIGESESRRLPISASRGVAI
jgi:hypothetical protein